MNNRVLCVSAAFTLFLASCGDDIICGAGTTNVDGTCVPDDTGLSCGDGTFEYNGECVAVDPNDTTAPVTTATPGGGRMRELPDGVVLRSDEPATIYYTTDGSDPTTSSDSDEGTVVLLGLADNTTVKFFAVDLNGNAESIKSETYTIDVTGPAAVTGMSAAISTADVSVTWTNPGDSDFAGVLVARGPVSRDPVDGTIYNMGDTLPGGETVVYVGTGTSANETLTLAGSIAEYAIWAFDDLGNYSPMRVTNAVEYALPAQNATLSVNLTTAAVTVTTPPSDLGLSATAVYDDPNDTLTITLDVTNNTGRVLSNLKAVTSNLNEGTIGGRTWQGSPFVYYGPEALAPSGSRSRDIVINGVTGGTDPITLDLSFITHPTLVAPAGDSGMRLIDSSGAIDTSTTLDEATLGTETYTRSVVTDPTGRFVVVVDKKLPLVHIIDLTTLENVASIQLGAFGSIGGTAIIGKRLYVAYSNGSHWSGAGGNENGDPGRGGVEIVAIDMTTFAEISRYTLVAIGPDGACARGLALTRDKARAVVAVGRAGLSTQELWIIDLAAMTPPTSGAIPLTPSYGWVTKPAWNDAGDTVYVTFDNYKHMYGGDGSTPPPIEVVDVASGGLSQLTPSANRLFGRGVIARGGKVYYVNGTSYVDTGVAPLTIFDSGGSESTPDTGYLADGAFGIVFDPSGDFYYVSSHDSDSCETATFDATTDTRVDRDGDGTMNLDVCVQHGGLATTPF